MVKCVVVGCKSGYSGQSLYTDNGIKITFHAFPKDTTLRIKWIKSIARDNWQPSKHSKLCSRHFQNKDFVKESRDTNKFRRMVLAEDGYTHNLKHRYLQAGAVPSLFLNSPAYFSKHGNAILSTTKDLSSCRRPEENKLLTLEQRLLVDDDISKLTLVEIANKLRSETTAPGEFTVTVMTDKLIIFNIAMKDDLPQIMCCITVRFDHTIVVSVDNKIVQQSAYSDLCGVKVKQISQLFNLMARLKHWITDPHSQSFKMLVQLGLKTLRTALGRHDDITSDEYKKVSFIVEQLELSTKAKYARVYSPQTIVMSYLMKATSTAAYNVLRDENVLSLPSRSTLQKVTMRLKGKHSLNNEGYLKLRVSQLTDWQRYVVLMVDEIYVAKRVEYAGGQVQGLTEDGEVASTLLCMDLFSKA